MNHSIYSADRTTHLKIVVVALVAGILIAGLSISAHNSSGEGFTQTASTARHEGRQAGRDYQLRELSRTLTKFTNSRGPLQPPKAHVDNKTPTTPKLTAENARSPRAFSFCGVVSARIVSAAPRRPVPSRSACR